jgi:hypothetical protein
MRIAESPTRQPGESVEPNLSACEADVDYSRDRPSAFFRVLSIATQTTSFQSVVVSALAIAWQSAYAALAAADSTVRPFSQSLLKRFVKLSAALSSTVIQYSSF